MKGHYKIRKELRIKDKITHDDNPPVLEPRIDADEGATVVKVGSTEGTEYERGDTSVVDVGENMGVEGAGENMGVEGVGSGVGAVDVGDNIGVEGVGSGVGAVDVGENIDVEGVGKDVGVIMDVESVENVGERVDVIGVDVTVDVEIGLRIGVDVRDSDDEEGKLEGAEGDKMEEDEENKGKVLVDGSGELNVV